MQIDKRRQSEPYFEPPVSLTTSETFHILPDWQAATATKMFEHLGGWKHKHGTLCYVTSLCSLALTKENRQVRPQR